MRLCAHKGKQSTLVKIALMCEIWNLRNLIIRESVNLINDKWNPENCFTLGFSVLVSVSSAVLQCFPIYIYKKCEWHKKRQVEEADLPLNWPHTACWQVVMASCPWNVFLYIFFFMCTNTRRLQIPVCQYETDWAEIREGFWDRRCWVRGYIYTDKQWEREILVDLM